MRNLIIDSRIRDIEYRYLRKYFIIHKLPLSDEVYEEISGHSDIFYCKINEEVICAPNSKIIEKNFKIGNSKVERTYPDDVHYNACQIGSIIIGSKFVDTCIVPDILVKQGYVKCSIAEIPGANACITTDKKISESLNKNNINSLYVEEDNIRLLKKDKTISNMKGFIGGATLGFDDKLVLFGDINYLNNKEKILEFVNKYKLQLIDFKGLDILDYGSGIIYN